VGKGKKRAEVTKDPGPNDAATSYRLVIVPVVIAAVMMMAVMVMAAAEDRFRTHEHQIRAVLALLPLHYLSYALPLFFVT
jgi:hypothetical protein